MRGARSAAIAVFFILALPFLSRAQPAARLLRTDSRAPYVHRLTLYDHAGRAIDPADAQALPYSPRATCTKCHAYAQISCGWHFNAFAPLATSDEATRGGRPPTADTRALRAAVPNGRPSEPWIYSDARTGIQLPISGRGWAGTFTPAQIGLSDFDFVLRFGRHLPGGGIGEPDDQAIEASPQAARWRISGNLEIDCMICHSTGQQHDPGEIERQVERQNFKWAPTAALGLGVVRGDAKSLPDGFDLDMPSPDRPDLALPKVAYDKSRFDADNRVLFEITRRPPAERCYFCHSTRAVSHGATPRWQTAGDVHIAAGLTCTDCHRADIDHMDARGYDSEAVLRGDTHLAALTCEGCHLGAQSISRTAASKQPIGVQSNIEIRNSKLPQGLYAAPRPSHAGIPPLHFEKMTCTACHSGPWPREYTRPVQTSLAHGLGVSTKDRHDDDWPRIVEPVFSRDDNGRIAPFRLLWPSYWGLRKDQALGPLPLPAFSKAADKVLGRKKPKPGEEIAPPSAEQIGQILAALAPKDAAAGVPVFVANGNITQRTASGGLETTQHPAAKPYLWAIGHDVRPAAESLGVRGCSDCHAADAPLLFGHIAGGPEEEKNKPVRLMNELSGYDRRLAQAWSAAFAARGAFKWTAFACIGFIVLILLRRVAWAGYPNPAAISSPPGRRRWLAAVQVLIALGALSGLVSGFGPEWAGHGHTAGWWLWIHIASAPLLIAGLTLLALLWACPRCRWGVVADWFTGLSLALGMLVIGSMLAAMLPLFGYDSQRFLIKLHRYAAIAWLIVFVVQFVVLLRPAAPKRST